MDYVYMRSSWYVFVVYGCIVYAHCMHGCDVYIHGVYDSSRIDSIYTMYMDIVYIYMVYTYMVYMHMVYIDFVYMYFEYRYSVSQCGIGLMKYVSQCGMMECQPFCRAWLTIEERYIGITISISYYQYLDINIQISNTCLDKSLTF